MATPFRMNLVDIEIKVLARRGRPIAKDKAYVDPDWRRARGKKVYTGTNTKDVLELRAQVVYERQDDKEASALGDSPRTNAHLTMRRTDYNNLPEKPEKGDLIVKVAGDSISPGYEVVEVRMAGYLRGKPNLVMIFFERSKENIGHP